MIKNRKRIFLPASIILILFAGSIAYLLLADRNSGPAKYAEIYRDDRLLDTVDLTVVDEPYQIRYDDGKGNYNIVEVRQGSIGIVDASCPDRLCQKMGFIHNSLMPVTCLPNHLVIRVIEHSSEKNSEGLDGLAF